MANVTDAYAMHQALRTVMRIENFKSGIRHFERQWYPQIPMRLKRIGAFTDLVTIVVTYTILALNGAFEELIVRRDTPRHSSGPSNNRVCDSYAHGTCNSMSQDAVDSGTAVSLIAHLSVKP
jgi:hypothetical protein